MLPVCVQDLAETTGTEGVHCSKLVSSCCDHWTVYSWLSALPTMVVITSLR